MKGNYKSAAVIMFLLIGLVSCGPMEKPHSGSTLPKQEQRIPEKNNIPPVEQSKPEVKSEETKADPAPNQEKQENQAKPKEQTAAVEEPATESDPNTNQPENSDIQASKPEEAGTTGPVSNTPPEIVHQFSSQAEYNPDIDIDALSQEPQSWGFKRNKEHQPVTAYYKADLPKYGTYYLGNTEEKVVYLTFDEGYENGFSPAILDTLKEKEIKAAFFITGSYLKHNPELVKRMRAEGHVVGNHSQTHPDFTTKTDEQVMEEVAQVGDRFKELTGTEIDPFFRFPSGRYTERDLYIIRKMGYRNVFWSMAYKDWEVDNQPGKEYALNHVMENYHPGAVILLHAVSSSNTEALAEIISGLDEAGYRFGSLYELE